MKDKICMWVAWHLPKRVVMWCAVRISAHASGPCYPHQIVPDLTVCDAVKRWETA